MITPSRRNGACIDLRRLQAQGKLQILNIDCNRFQFLYRLERTFSNMNIFSEYSNPPTTIPYEQTKDQADYLMPALNLT